MTESIRTKSAVIQALNEQIASLTALVKSMEESTVPDLRELSELPELLVQRREQLNLWPGEISELAGLSPNTYRALERSDANPRLGTLENVGKVLNFKLWVEML